MCSRATATRPGVTSASLALGLVVGLLGPVAGCGESSDDGDSPESTATASSAATGGSSAGGSSAGGSDGAASGTTGEADTGGTGGGSAGTGGGSAATGGAGGSPVGSDGGGGDTDTTSTSDTSGTGTSGAGGAASDGVACVAQGAFCRVAPGPCPEMQVRAVEGSCWGDCVPIGSCTCAGPEDCPDESQYTCHNFSGRCGPYL